ncbi:MAG: acyltransferase [Prevotellaceae bacterium]|jgi:predicted LPLAT superfamily acyltransferase|nr:acyltransferase [Prevotellaceae bacterium]
MMPAQWTGKTDGKEWMLRVLIFFLRWTDLRIFYLLMGCVVPFYMLFVHKGYIAAYRYFRRQFACPPLKAFGKVYANHFVFGQIILDRFAVYAGKRFDLTIEGNDAFTELAARPEGFVMLSSHTGNFELAGYSLIARGKRFYSLVFPHEKETVMANRNQLFEQNNIVMVPVSEDMSHLFILNDALCNGNIVTMPGDRIFGSQKGVECRFLQGNARFPLGPFAVAVQRDVPLLSVFVMKESTRRYRLFVSPIRLPRAAQQAGNKEKMAMLAQSFADEMERVVRKYPTQWFNYYDFWERGTETAPEPIK